MITQVEQRTGAYSDVHLVLRFVPVEGFFTPVGDFCPRLSLSLTESVEAKQAKAACSSFLSSRFPSWSRLKIDANLTLSQKRNILIS
jgi:hypothetical protein